MSALPASLQRLRPWCLLIFAGLGLYFSIVGYRDIWRQTPDFEYFYKGGAWLYHHGGIDAGYDVLTDKEDILENDGRRVQPRGTIEWYWPVVPRLLTLICWLPFPVAGGIWLALNLLALFITLRLMTQYLSGLAARDWPIAQLLPFLFIIVFWAWEFLLNQINNFTLLLLLASFVLWLRGRRVIAGFWLGLAVLLKITPLVIVFWFLLKRQFRTVAAALLTVVLAGPVSDLIVFGPEYTRDVYRAWMHISVEKSSLRNLVLLQREMDWRNQSLAAVMSRWLHPTNCSWKLDNEPRYKTIHPARTINIADLPLTTVATLVMAVAGLSLLGLTWFARKPAAALTPWQLRFEWVLFLLAMLWLMPVLRRYHLILCFPAMSLLTGAMYCVGRRRAWFWLTSICVGLVVVAQMSIWSEWFSWSNPTESMGVLLGVIPALAVPVVVMLRWLARDPLAIPLPQESAAPESRARALPPYPSSTSWPAHG